MTSPLLVSLTDDPQLLANAVFSRCSLQPRIDGLSELTYELSELNDTGDLIRVGPAAKCCSGPRTPGFTSTTTLTA